MLEKPLLSDQIIIDCLIADYGIEAVTVIFLPLGADMNAAIYKAQAKDRSSYFIKLKRGHHHDINARILTMLHDAGIEEIIAPIKTTHARLTSQVDGFSIIVYPFIEAEDGFSRDLTDEQWAALGKMLRQVHELDVPAPFKAQIKKETYSSQWREAVRSFYPHTTAESYGDETASKLVKFMKEHDREIHRLVDRAEQLSHKIRKQSPEFVLCHADLHAGNVLIDGTGSIYIVDWDEPILAPKERDLMFIGGGIANVWNNPHEEELFYKGYGKTKIDRTILAYYRHERIVQDIAEYGQKLLLSMEGGKDRLEMYKQFIDMFKPRGVVDIAFKTDESLPT